MTFWNLPRIRCRLLQL